METLELNYFIGGDEKLNSLDTGSFNRFSSEEVDVFIPVFSSNEKTVYSKPRIVDTTGGGSSEGGSITASGAGYPLIQPKLSLIVKRIINAPGYAVSGSVFDAGFLQYLRLPNGRKTAKYSAMMPDRTYMYRFRGHSFQSPAVEKK